MKEFMKKYLYLMAVFLILVINTKHANAATGEMGTGIPALFGTYAAGAYPSQGTIVWQLAEASVGFPAGCASLRITRATMGDDYKIAIATLLTARTTKRKVRFYAHVERDGGCGIDYIQLND